MAFGASSNLSAIRLFNDTSYFRNNEARATFDWAIANRFPTQILGPAPNGKKTPEEIRKTEKITYFFTFEPFID
jgi:hypothetical protein